MITRPRLNKHEIRFSVIKESRGCAAEKLARQLINKSITLHAAKLIFNV